ncbi:MAG: hypothetical protein J0I26_00065 [Alphaproteobacteria bacterium]|nr:hypothetical protein [Alphaproteobacteria bacterium]MBN9578407.1 hypothetical protein [Alphaproteobacteria bacterium]MBN9590904.1 hypothetical protein [Alphaproteobacteria bacterium]
MKSAVLAAGCSIALLMAAGSANALTMKECSAKYKAAQTAKTLNGMSWSDFRKANCGSSTGGTAKTMAPASTSAAMTGTAMTGTAKAPAATHSMAMAPMSTGSAIFPTAVSAKYSKETAAKARMHTCLDQYNANKAANHNGGMKWIMKGGGYYSACNSHLKG